MAKISDIAFANSKNRESLSKSVWEQNIDYSFEDFCSDRTWEPNAPQWRRFVHYLPHITWGVLTPIVTVPEQVNQTLWLWLNKQITISDEVDNEKGKKITHYTISALDLPTLSWVDLIGNGWKIDDMKLYNAIEQFFFIQNTSKTDPAYETKVVNRLNSCLNYSLYAYNYVYYRNVPQELRKLYFRNFDDIKDFIKKTTREWVLRHVYCELLKHMLCFNYALHKKTVAKWEQYLTKLESQLSQNFFPTSLESEEDGISTGKFVVPLGDTTRTITYKKRSRAKNIFSAEQKLLWSPKEDEESIFNDTLWIEFTFETKEDILFFLYILYEKHISPNRISFLKNKIIPWMDERAIILQSLLEGRDFRQKWLFTEEEIEDFIQKYGAHITDSFIFLLRNLDTVKKVWTSEDYQDIKFQWRYNFWSSLWINTIEIRCILEGNKNESWLWHNLIRKGLKTILAQIRKWYYVTENYIYRVAYISFLKSDGEVPLDEIFEYYKSELSPFALSNGRWKESDMHWIYTDKAHWERLQKHGFSLIWIKNYKWLDLK